ncbi:MAG: metal ABC transporter ATP-binding protein [Bacilli bacterium]
MTTPLTVEGLTVAYQKKVVVENVSFSAPEGQLIGIIGANGAGKSTLIKAILELIPRVTGTVTLFDKPYNTERKRIGYVPQRESVDWDFPTNARDVVMMGCYGKMGLFSRVGGRERTIADDALRKVGMLDYADRQISQLSGGQQQRVFLARALAQDADLYFMDEPFVGVDATTEKAIIALLNELKQNGKTVLVVHHDLATVEEYFDYCMLLNKRLIAFGPTHETFTIENLKHAYGGSLAFIDRITR